MKFFALLAMLLAFNTAFAEDCTKTLFEAAKAIDTISNEIQPEDYDFVDATLLKTRRFGGDKYETYEDQTVIYNVELTEKFCIIKTVTYVTGTKKI